jgi:hypothetical protein
MIDSSSVVDTILQKKKILALTSDSFGLNEKNYALGNINRYGISHLDIERDFDKSSQFILNLLERKVQGYDKYIS